MYLEDGWNNSKSEENGPSGICSKNVGHTQDLKKWNSNVMFILWLTFLFYKKITSKMFQKNGLFFIFLDVHVSHSK